MRETREICKDCGGSGRLLEWGKREITCYRCSGSGTELILVPEPEAVKLFEPAPTQMPGQLNLACSYNADHGLEHQAGDDFYGLS